MRNEIYRKIKSQIKDTVFKDYSENIWIYLKATNTRGSNYDPFRETGYTKTYQSPIALKAHVRTLSSSSLIVRELGLLESGAIEIFIEDSDINLIKNCQKIRYNDEYYTPFRDALGNRVQINKASYGFAKIVLFRIGND